MILTLPYSINLSRQPTAHYCFSSIAIYSLFQNETLIFSTPQLTYHPRLQNKAMEEYLCQFPHPSLATRAILILRAPQQSPRHASDQVLQIRILLPRLWITIRIQDLRGPLFELEGGDDFVILQILEFPDSQIFPQLSPHIFVLIQISTAGWEPHCCQAMLVVLTIDLQELLIIEPHPQPLEAGT